jgi:hypothetical protein
MAEMEDDPNADFLGWLDAGMAVWKQYCRCKAG